MVLIAIYVILAAVAVMSLNWVLFYVDKLRVYKIITLAISALGIVIFFTSLSGDQASFYATCFFLVVVGILVGPIYAIDGFFLKDLIMYDTFLTGLNRENMYQVSKW